MLQCYVVTTLMLFSGSERERKSLPVSNAWAKRIVMIALAIYRVTAYCSCVHLTAPPWTIQEEALQAPDGGREEWKPSLHEPGWQRLWYCRWANWLASVWPSEQTGGMRFLPQVSQVLHFYILKTQSQNADLKSHTVGYMGGGVNRYTVSEMKGLQVELLKFPTENNS